MERSIPGRAGRLVVVSLIFSFIILVTVSFANAAEPIKIGMVVSVTGPVGYLGTYQKEAMTALVEDINSKGGVLGRPLEVYLEDDQSAPTTAVIAATKLIRDKKVAAVIGPTTTDAGMAMAPICEQEQLPFIAYSPMVSPFKKWLFLLGPGDARIASHLAEDAVGLLGAKRIALLHDSAYYGTTAARIIRKKIDEYPGVSIVVQEQFERADTNMIAQLMRIKAAKPDLIILQCTGGAMAAIIAKNYKQLGMTTRLVSSGSLSQKDFMKLGGGQIAEENGWMALLLKISVAERISPTDPFRKSVYEPFKKAFQDKYGKDRDVNVFHAGPPDAVNILVAALKIAGTDDRAALRDAIEKVRIEGMLGPFACSPTDHQGSPKDVSIWSVVKAGEWVPHKE